MVSEIFPSSPTYFQIQLQNDSFHSYIAGQTIIGRVVVELKDKLKIMGAILIKCNCENGIHYTFNSIYVFFLQAALKIELLGKGVVHWDKEHYFIDSHNGTRRLSRPAYFPRRILIPEEETYIYQEKYLIGESKHYHEMQQMDTSNVYLDQLKHVMHDSDFVQTRYLFI